MSMLETFLKEKLKGKNIIESKKVVIAQLKPINFLILTVNWKAYCANDSYSWFARAT
jgi:hypothetical protein